MLGYVLLDLVVKATVILFVAGIATAALRKRAAAVRHSVWVIAFVSLLVLPVGEALNPRWTLVRVASAPAPSMVMVTPDFVPTSVPVPEAPKVDPSVRVAEVWGMGTAVVVGLLLLGYVNLRRIRSTAVSLPGDLEVLASEENVRLRQSLEGRPPTALTWGFWQPTILFPSDLNSWSEDRLSTVLHHEIAHVRRADALYQALGSAVCALYWFHPAVWIAAKAARSAAEAATDDAVLQSGVRPSAYASTLLEVAAELGGKRGLRSGVTVEFAKEAKIETRLKAILDNSVRRVASRREKLFAAGVTAALLLPLLFIKAAAVEPFAAVSSPSNNLTLAEAIHPAPSFDAESGPQVTISSRPLVPPVPEGASWIRGTDVTPPAPPMVALKKDSFGRHMLAIVQQSMKMAREKIARAISQPVLVYRPLTPQQVQILSRLKEIRIQAMPVQQIQILLDDVKKEQ